jgi:hypothetical protein
MRMLSSAIRIAVVAAALALCACDERTVTTEMRGDLRVDRVDQAFDLDEGIRRVAIDNPWGEINVRGRDEREMGIHAVVQRLPPRHADVHFATRREGDTLHVDVVADCAPSDTPATCARADLAVYVPGDLAISLKTRDSRIAATRRAGSIEATSDSGEIHASSLAQLKLHSASGQIRAIAIGKRWNGKSEITTDSGRIVLLVPTFGDVALEASTAGKLSSGFGLSVHTLAGGTHEAHARYGAGTSALQARSKTGEIVLDQLVLLGDDSRLPEDDD